MFSQEREFQSSFKKPIAGPSRYQGYVSIPVNSTQMEPCQQQESHRDDGIVTINLEGNGNSSGVCYAHRSTETFSGLLAARSFNSDEENELVGNEYFPKLSSFMSTSCHAIGGKLRYTRNSSVSCAIKSWWHSFQTSFTSIKQSVLTMIQFPDLIVPSWTLRIRKEYTSDGSLVTDINEILNFPSKQAAELYFKQWLEEVQREGDVAEYVIDLFLQQSDEEDVELEAMRPHGQQYEISQQEAEEEV